LFDLAIFVDGDRAIFIESRSAPSRAIRTLPLLLIAPSHSERRFAKETVMMFRRIGFALVLLLASASLYAQETTGTIQGRIVDAQGLAIPGVTVTVTGTQGAKTAVSDAGGRFNIPFLTPGTYTVRAELQGFKTVNHSGASVGLGQTLDVPLTMQVGGLTETVNVTGAPTMIDTTSTTTGAVLSSDLLNRVPVGRRVSDALYLAPGVSSSGSAGSANPSMSGGSGLDNLYVIDGVNVTNQGYGALGSYSIVFGSLGNATPFDFVQEIQVKTGGYEAEFGQSTGGVVNVVTKSGSNLVRGSAFAYAQPTKTEGTWTQLQTPNGTVQTLGSRNYDAGLEGGGPLVKNHVFFFGAIDPRYEYQTFQAPAGFPLLDLGGVQRERRSISYSAKGTVQITNGQRFDASFFGDPSKGYNGPQRSNALLASQLTRFSSINYGGHNQTVHYDGVLSSSWLVEAYWARALNNLTELPQINQWNQLDTTVTPNVRTGGIGFFEGGNHSLNNQFAAKMTNLFGGHQIKYGLEYDNVEYDNITQYSGPTFTAPNGQQTQTGATISVIPDATFGRIYRVTRGNFNAARTTQQKFVDFFVQDTWKVGNRLTINPGIRYAQEKLAGEIINDFSLKNNWAPRIGATYDPFGDAKSKLYGNFGIFYSRVPNDLAARALSADNGMSRADYFDAGLTQPIPNGVATINPTTGASITNHFALQGVGADTIDPNAKLSYVREFVAGFEREVMPHTTAGIRYLHRSIPRVLEDVANCPMAAYFIDQTASACGSVEYILTNPSSATPINPAATFLGASFDNPVHKYDAVELTLNRRFSNNWSALASYRWSRLRGNFEGFYRDDNGQSDPGISSLYDFPTNDPSYTGPIGQANGFLGDIRFLGDPNGILPLDRPHQIKLVGNYQFPMGLSLGLNFQAVSGKPLTALADNPEYTNGGEIPLTARGAGFQTVDGFKTRTPFQTSTDVQASYIVRLGGERNVTLMADIFNLFNQQIVLDYDNFFDLSTGAPQNPNYGTRTSENVAGPQYQTPRQVRFGVRFAF
jgi:hypothetical protein